MVKAKVVAKFPANAKKFIAFVRAIIVALTNNPTFPLLPVTVQVLNDMVNALEALEAAVAKRTLGAADVRDAQRAKLEDALRLVEAYLQSVVVTLPADAQAAAINSSGFVQKKVIVRQKDPYSVGRAKNQSQGGVTVQLKAQGRTGKVTYCHQYSVNGGQAWIDATPTPYAKLVINGLPLGQTVSFRFRTLIKGVYGDWSQTLVFLVH